ncbi:hypothetical protein [Clostridium botulinum]|uniref:hypothetical protein n=1 Tax=Clostridium botulinum TaxID=1491 RepID=UPI000305EC16|nr:hypothetical protein [Clostridium botulinum]KLU76028.1 hypothetical protein CBC3_06090 [Clostridium botulinum V891]KOA72899.1 hypothetical protein ADU78_13860 [Clostridium botulinum]KOA93032.1 hypothetical protein ADU76_07150 [Clostridium botulinum]KOC31180.1 hypothetical protein ADU81_14100 [Clostridium botulinum]MCD3204193.1 hypothetical protein [Clostridium botulinum C/D]
MKYKPETLEENLSNTIWIQNNIYQIINHLTIRFNVIQNIYRNQYTYNQALRMGFINYNWNYEIAMAELAYSIYGFTNDIYNRIAYALDFINRNEVGRSIKNYDRDIKKLSKKELISEQDKEDLLRFRLARNYGTHYGKVMFIDYIFRNVHLIYNVVGIIKQLLSSYTINIVEYKSFLENQYSFIQDLKSNLEDYEIANCIAK